MQHDQGDDVSGKEVSEAEIQRIEREVSKRGISSHADIEILRDAAEGWPTPNSYTAACDRLEAEINRLRDERDEWERIAVRTSAEAGNEIRRIRAEALAGDAE